MYDKDQHAHGHGLGLVHVLSQLNSDGMLGMSTSRAEPKLKVWARFEKNGANFIRAQAKTSFFLAKFFWLIRAFGSGLT